MRKISTVGKWFFGLFLLLFAFIIAMSFIFLLRPEYFIDDIKSFIEDRLPSSIVDEFNIGSVLYNRRIETGLRQQRKTSEPHRPREQYII